MQQNDDINEIKNLLTGFIKEQKAFNERIDKKAGDFIKYQEGFNERIDKKLDKVQYFLEETIAENTKMFFEEQIEMKNYIRELEQKIKELDGKFLDLSSRVNLLFKN